MKGQITFVRNSLLPSNFSAVKDKPGEEKLDDISVKFFKLEYQLTFTPLGEDEANKRFPSRLVDDRGDLELKDEFLPSSFKPFLRNFSAFLGVAPVGNSFLFSLLSITVSS